MSDQPLTEPVQERIVGFYGKMPSRGDFVRRGLPDSFVNPWDTWLQEMMAHTQSEFGDDWLDAYLNAPIWYFVFSPDVLDEHLWAGAMMPSVDRVGRYFPLVQAIGLSGCEGLVTVRAALEDWFQTAKESLLDALEQDELDIDLFFEALATNEATQVAMPPSLDAALHPHPEVRAVALAGPADRIFGATGLDAMLNQTFA